MQQTNDNQNPFWIRVSSPFWVIIVRLLAALLAIYVIWRIQLVLVSVMVAVILTYIMLPAVEWLSMHLLVPKRCDDERLSDKPRWKQLCSSMSLKYNDRRLLATVIVFFSFIAILVIGTNVLLAPFTKEIQQFSANFSEYVTKTGSLMERAGAWYYDAVPETVRGWISGLDKTNLVEIAGGYVQRTLKFVTSSVGIVMELFLIPVLAFYFLLDYRSITSEIYGALPHRRLRDGLRIGRRLGQILQSYVIGQLILCAIAGILTGLFLSVLDMPYVLVLALFAAITRAIPVIGPVVSGIPIVLVGLLKTDRVDIALILLIFVTVMHFAESKFVMPKLIGDRLHLRPAVVIIVLLIGAEFFGLIGMFLAAPVAAIIRDIIRYYYILPRRSKQVNPMGER
jgi:predicted PurR-regulated permease PerM